MNPVLHHLYNYYDILGQELFPGDIIVYTTSTAPPSELKEYTTNFKLKYNQTRGLAIGKLTGLYSEGLIRVIRMGQKEWAYEHRDMHFHHRPMCPIDEKHKEAVEKYMNAPNFNIDIIRANANSEHKHFIPFTELKTVFISEDKKLRYQTLSKTETLRVDILPYNKKNKYFIPRIFKLNLRND